MIRFARLLAASAIGTGIGIGLILCSSLTPLLRPTVSGAPTTTGGVTRVSLVTTDWCAQPQSNDPDVQAWVGVQCAVHSALFDDGEEPSAGYRLDDEITGPGFYTGLNHADKEIDLEAVHVVEADLATEAPGWLADGATLHTVIGKLHGVAGSVAIVGSVLYYPMLDDAPLLVVADILTASEIGTFIHAAAIRAGVMVQEEGDGFGPPPPPYSLATATNLPENLWAFESDLSVLYGDQAATANPTCVQTAYNAFIIAVTAADATLANCLNNAAFNLRICIDLALITGLHCAWSLGFSCVLAAAGIAACVAYHAHAVKTCNNAYSIAITAASATLTAALLACGVTILED